MGLFIITDDIKKILENHLDTIADLQDILIDLKKLGYSQIDSIKILMDVLSISLPEANEIISSSRAWNSNSNSF